MVGIPTRSTSLRAEHGDAIEFVSYTGAAVNGELHRQGDLEILPCHYSQLPKLLEQGRYAADVVLLQLPPPNATGSYSLGLANDYLYTAAKRARTVVAEVNEAVPFTFGPTLDSDDVDIVTCSSAALSVLVHDIPGDRERLIADHIAGLIHDGATLQLGVGQLPDAVMSALVGHRRLGIHSGLITDGVMRLMQSGVVDNSAKGIDRGVSVTGLIVGSQELFDFVDNNPEIAVRETQYTHDPEVLASVNQLTSITPRSKSISPAK